MTGVLVGGAMLFMASNARSANVTLADLSVPGTSITYGDKVFYDFSDISQVGDLTVPLSDIYVVPVLINGDYGIQFQSALWSLSGADQNYDLSVYFQVTTTSGLPLIEDNTLTVSGGVQNGGAFDIEENITDPDYHTLANSYVYENSIGGSIQDHETFGGLYAVIDVDKDFAMSTGDNPLGEVSVSHFIQTFSQVPEPSSALFLGLGGLVLACCRRFTR